MTKRSLGTSGLYRRIAYLKKLNNFRALCNLFHAATIAPDCQPDRRPFCEEAWCMVRLKVLPNRSLRGICCRSTACLNPKITVHAKCRHTHLWQWVAWMVRPKWLHRPHNPLREGHLSWVGVEGLFLLDASWQTACLRLLR